MSSIRSELEQMIDSVSRQIDVRSIRPSNRINDGRAHTIDHEAENKNRAVGRDLRWKKSQWGEGHIYQAKMWRKRQPNKFGSISDAIVEANLTDIEWNTSTEDCSDFLGRRSSAQFVESCRKLGRKRGIPLGRKIWTGTPDGTMK